MDIEAIARKYRFRGMTVNGEWVEGNLNVVTDKRAGVEPGVYISNGVGVPFAYDVRPETVQLVEAAGVPQMEKVCEALKPFIEKGVICPQACEECDFVKIFGDGKGKIATCEDRILRDAYREWEARG